MLVVIGLCRSMIHKNFGGRIMPSLFFTFFLLGGDEKVYMIRSRLCVSRFKKKMYWCDVI